MKPVFKSLARIAIFTSAIIVIIASIAPARAFDNLKIGNLGVSALTLQQVTNAGAVTTNSITASSILPGTDNLYDNGSSAFRWKSLSAVSVSSTNITATGYVSTTKLYVDGGNGNYVTFDPGARFIAYAAYGSPSVITFFPFSDGNNYMRGTTTYITNTIQSESGTNWRITSAGFVSSTTLSVGNTGAVVNKYAEGSASLDFGATAAGACEELTVSTPFAVDGDAVSCGIPNALAASDSYQSFQCFVSAAGTVTVKRCNLLNSGAALSNPAAATVKTKILD